MFQRGEVPVIETNTSKTRDKVCKWGQSFRTKGYLTTWGVLLDYLPKWKKNGDTHQHNKEDNQDRKQQMTKKLGSFSHHNPDDARSHYDTVNPRNKWR